MKDKLFYYKDKFFYLIDDMHFRISETLSMISKKWMIATGIIIAAALIISASTMFFLSETGVLPNRMAVYFFSPSMGQLVSENRIWPEGDNNMRIQQTLMYLASEPDDRTLTSTWPTAELNELITSMYMDGHYNDMLVVNFTENFNEMSPLEESLFRSAFTLTLMELPFVGSVKFRVASYNGIHESVESLETIANNPIISPARLSNVQFILYLIDESMEGLITQVYDATNVDIQQRGLVALERLIDAQQAEGIIAAIPTETRIRSVTTDTEARGIYVDLSSEFVAQFTGSPALARLMVYSIVNTVLENTTGAQNRVFFLIDSDRQESFHGISDFKSAFSFNESVMIGYIADYQTEGEDE